MPDWLPASLADKMRDYDHGADAIEVDAGAGGGSTTVEDALVSFLNGTTPGAPDRVDLAIVGARSSRGFLRRAVAGSVSRYLLHHCKVPLLVVRAPPPGPGRAEAGAPAEADAARASLTATAAEPRWRTGRWRGNVVGIAHDGSDAGRALRNKSFQLPFKVHLLEKEESACTCRYVFMVVVCQALNAGTALVRWSLANFVRTPYQHLSPLCLIMLSAYDDPHTEPAPLLQLDTAPVSVPPHNDASQVCCKCGLRLM